MVSFPRSDSFSDHFEILTPGDCCRTGDRRQFLTINGTLPLHFDLFVAPVAIVGALLGVFVLKYIPQKIFDTLALTLAGIAADRLIMV